MLNSVILKSINSVDSISEFNLLLSKFQLSEASSEIKEEAIRELKVRKSIFYIHPNHTPREVYNDILEGAADIDDIG